MATEAERVGATGVKRNLFRSLLVRKMLPLVRSGRLSRDQLQAYRAELKSARMPQWMRQDAERVLAIIGRAVQHPGYRYEQSLAGDFGGLGGFFDTIANVASTVYGAGSAAVSAVVGIAPTVGTIAQTIAETAPAVSTAWQERDTIVAAAPIVSQVYGAGTAVYEAAQKPVLFGLTPLMLGGIALAAYLVLRR